MSADLQRTCPSCGTDFSGAVEFCPVSMLRKAALLRLSPESLCEADITRRGATLGHNQLVKSEDGKPVELGRGAKGVYKAFDVDLRYAVTLKVISENYLGDESARLDFSREARAAASVWHPNVASVFHLSEPVRTTFTRCSLSRAKCWRALSKAHVRSR